VIQSHNTSAYEHCMSKLAEINCNSMLRMKSLNPYKNRVFCARCDELLQREKYVFFSSNQVVGGSNPSGRANKINKLRAPLAGKPDHLVFYGTGVLVRPI
jgi:hypothetical protein